jgi:hypothetical protein
MKHTPLALIVAALLALPGFAQTETESVAAADQAPATGMEAVDPLAPRDARDVTLAEFQWVARPILVFADTPADPRFIEQLQLLTQRPEALLARDVVIITDSDPSANSAIRTQLRPRGFALVVLQKDGAIGFRRPAPRDVREIIRGIDNFSFRQEELRMGLQ